MHCDAPGEDAYVPALQEAHTLALVAPITLEYVPIGHVAQLETPSVAEYVPFWHGKQLSTEVAPDIKLYVP